MSKGEQKIEQLIRDEIRKPTSSYICFRREQTFPKLKYRGHLLRFDFAVYKKNENSNSPDITLIEFDGIQHLEQQKFFQKTTNKFSHYKENDRRKNQYVLDNNIKLYRIPYWELDNINNFYDILQDKYLVKSKYHNDNLIWQINLNNKD